MTTLEIPHGFDDPMRDVYLAWRKCVEEHADTQAFNECPELRLRRYAQFGLNAIEAASLINADNEKALSALILARLRKAQQELNTIEQLIQLG